MKLRLLIFVVLLTSPLACEPADTSGKPELAKLQGTWVKEEKLPNGKLFKLIIIISGDKIVFTGTLDGKEGTRTETTFTIDPGQAPPHIDITEVQKGKAITRPGLYEIDGDMLTITVGLRDRPKKIDQLSGSLRYQGKKAKP